MENSVPVRCKKCRKVLFVHPECPLLDAHGDVIGGKQDSKEECLTAPHSLWYLDSEKMPLWISSHIEENGWTKGKLCCPSCNCRLGSFDFVSGGQCSCHSYTLPNLHLVKAKVDVVFSCSLPISTAST